MLVCFFFNAMVIAMHYSEMSCHTFRYPVLLGPFIVYSFRRLVRLPQSYFWSSVGLCLCLCFDCLHPLGITQNSPFQSLPSVPSPLNRPPRRHFDIWHMFVLDILEIRLAFWNPISTWWHIVSNILWCLLWPMLELEYSKSKWHHYSYMHPFLV